MGLWPEISTKLGSRTTLPASGPSSQQGCRGYSSRRWTVFTMRCERPDSSVHGTKRLQGLTFVGALLQRLPIGREQRWITSIFSMRRRCRSWMPRTRQDPPRFWGHMYRFLTYRTTCQLWLTSVLTCPSDYYDNQEPAQFELILA